MATAPKLLTLEEFLKLPEEEPALEFAAGEVTQKVSPRGKHSALQGDLWDIINRFARPPKLARVFTELRITFAGASRVPDVSIYRWERVPLDAQGCIADDFVEPPDLVVEIVSPEQRVTALVRRCLWYVAHGVKIAPLALRDTDRIGVDEVLPGFELSVAGLFASLRMD
jgi:Uma2 family endonuclease